MNDIDRAHLRRCVALAREALEAGDQPFGSVLAAADGAVLQEDRNRVGTGNGTLHPELALAQWAAEHLSQDERAAATVYTSGEHCSMCAAAHAWVGLGRIVYATSTGQRVVWRTEFGAPSLPIAPLSIAEVAPGLVAEGPVAEFAEEIRELHRRACERI